MGTTATGRGYAKGRAKRDEIIDAATALFGEVGYRAASLREISARVGISHPGLLHHFPTKDALLAEVLDRRDEEDADLADPRTGGEDFTDGVLRLVERNTAKPWIVELYCVLSAEATSPDHPAHDYFRNRYERICRQMTEAVRPRLAASGAPGLDAETFARTVVALMDGLQVQWLLERGSPDQVDMGAVLRAYLEQTLPPAV